MNFAEKKMKKIILLIATIVCKTSFGQQINYNITHNKPIFPKYSLNLDLMNMDANFKNFDNLSFNAGLWGYASVFKGLEIHFNAQKSYLTLGKLINKSYNGNTELNVGAAFFLKNFIRNENLKVILSQRTSYSGNYTITNYIEVPGQVAYKLGIQGGLYFKNGPFKLESSYQDQRYNMTNAGLYAGALLRRSNSLKISYENGKKWALNSANYDIYFDALYLPINQFKSSETALEMTETTKNSIAQSPIGFRFGCKVYQVESKAISGKRFGIAYSMSIGKKPYQGWFLTSSIGLTLLKK